MKHKLQYIVSNYDFSKFK